MRFSKLGVFANALERCIWFCGASRSRSDTIMPLSSNRHGKPVQRQGLLFFPSRCFGILIEEMQTVAVPVMFSRRKGNTMSSDLLDDEEPVMKIVASSPPDRRTELEIAYDVPMDE